MEIRKSNAMKTHFSLVAVVVAFTAMGAGCEKPPPCVDHSKKPLEACKLNADKLQSEILDLKRQLALAKASPGTINVNDPSVTEVEGDKPHVPKPIEGNLSQAQVVGVIKKNIPALRKCYERAMKKNSSLQMSKVKLSIEFKVTPRGAPSGVYIRPIKDVKMNDCMKRLIGRWRFPAFTGQPVGVVYPLTLSPRK